MRQRAIAALLVVVVLLSGGVAVASHALVVGSIHTTASDFNGASLTNATIEGSGTGADVTFTDEVTDVYNPRSETSTESIQYQPFAGTTNGVTTKAEVKLTPSSSGTIQELSPYIGIVDGSDYGYVVDVYISQGTPDTTYGEGTLIADNWDPDYSTGRQTIQLDNPYQVTSENTYTLSFVTQSADSSNSFNYLQLRLEEGYNNGFLDSNLGSVLDMAGDVNVDVLRQIPSGSYVSETHPIEESQTAFADLTLQNAEATVEWEFYDGSSWQVANSATYSSSGNHTLDVSGHASASQWRADVSFTNQPGGTTARLEDEGVMFAAAAPTVSNPDPAGGETLQTTDPTLSATVSDADFPTAQGDTVTADIYLDGAKVGSQTVTSNGSISTTVSGVTASSHTWHVELTDEYGHTVTGPTWSFTTPTEVQIFNESQPNTLIQSPAGVTMQFFAQNGTVYERTTTDGTVDITGLPLDQPLTATVSAENFTTRSIYLESLFAQNRVYLLHESVPAANVVYSLVDNTGQFSPPEATTLFVEKPLNISGNTKFQTITSGQFSATNEIPVTLENDQRYRLRLEGPRNNTRVLGSYTTSGDDAATLTVGQVTFGGARATNPSFTASVTEIDGARVLEIKYYDPANATDALTIGVTNRTSGAIFRPTTTETGPYGTYREIIPIASNAEYVSYNVTYTAQRDGYQDTNGTIFTGDLPKIAQELGLDPRILGALAYLVLLSTLGMFAISSPRFSGIPTAVVAVGLVGFGAVAIHPLVISGIGVMAILFALGGGR